MSIARGIHQTHKSPSGATYPICLNHGLHGLHGGRNCLNQDTKDLQDKGREAEKARDRKARQFIGVLSD